MRANLTCRFRCAESWLVNRIGRLSQRFSRTGRRARSIDLLVGRKRAGFLRQETFQAGQLSYTISQLDDDSYAYS
jgi:hypothetical protein